MSSRQTGTAVIDGNTIASNEGITGIDVFAVNVTITNNTITYSQAGIYVDYYGNAVINNNVLSCNNRDYTANLISHSTFTLNAQTPCQE